MHHSNQKAFSEQQMQRKQAQTFQLVHPLWLSPVPRFFERLVSLSHPVSCSFLPKTLIFIGNLQSLLPWLFCENRPPVNAKKVTFWELSCVGALKSTHKQLSANICQASIVCYMDQEPHGGSLTLLRSLATEHGQRQYHAHLSVFVVAPHCAL